MEFKRLHDQDNPLLICNVWDVASASVAKTLNFQAVGTSSAAIAGMLGYKDGEFMPFSELKFIVERIKKSIDIPLSVDLEAGFSRDPHQIFKHIKVLADLGVVGINLEDSLVVDERTLLPAESFAKTLAFIKNEVEKQAIDMFVNVRTDTFLLGGENLIDATLTRTEIYTEAGADGIFVPCIEKESDIASIVGQIPLPLNVMCMPNLSNFEKLKEIGVKRISMGNFLHHKLHKQFETMLKSINSSKSFQPIF